MRQLSAGKSVGSSDFSPGSPRGEEGGKLREQATAEEEEEQDSGERVAEEEHEEDEEAPATEAGGSEGSNESVSTDSHEELPVLQASDREEDNERSVRRFGYNPDGEVSDEEEHYGRSERRFGYNPDNGDPWAEYQGVMGDDLFAW